MIGDTLQIISKPSLVQVVTLHEPILSESIRLSTLRPVANDLLNDALRLDNELSALTLWSVSKVQINHLGLQNPL